MDFRLRDQSWISQLNEVFKEDFNTLLDNSGRDLREQTNKLKELLRHRTRIWWNKAFLDRYLSKGLVPRGLRIQVFPSFPTDEGVFKDKWESLATTCSRGFMDLLIQSNTTTLVGIEKEIEDLQISLKKDLSSEALDQLNTDLEKDFQKWEQEICSIKTKKFQRDITDFQQGRVYKWRRGNPRVGPRSRSGSMSSQTSDEQTGNRWTGESALNRPDPIFPRRNRERQAAKRKTPSPYERGKKPKNLEVINLSKYTLSDTQCDILNKGLSFSPSNSFDYFTALKDLHLFSRKLVLRKLHSRGDMDLGLNTTLEKEALSALEELLQEQTSPQQDLDPVVVLS
ncbi:uncharacterized protein LOC142658921 [Rhinoderma darwinii]|uniref:uncharacterized protein LOC142658920 n=1 Tax=Rhinoderma darwinii TaxID=43563 RepID=UPI003F66EA52